MAQTLFHVGELQLGVEALHNGSDQEAQDDNDGNDVVRAKEQPRHDLAAAAQAVAVAANTVCFQIIGNLETMHD